MLRHGVKTVHDLARHQAEIAHIRRNLHLGKLIEQSIEHIGGKEFEPVLAGAALPLAIDHIVTLRYALSHIRQQFRRVLQISIDNQHLFAARQA